MIKMADIVDEIAAASNEQANGISQVNIGLAQVDQATQQNTANAEETASATQELFRHASKLRETMNRFKLNHIDHVVNEEYTEFQPLPFFEENNGKENTDTSESEFSIEDEHEGRDKYLLSFDD